MTDLCVCAVYVEETFSVDILSDGRIETNFGTIIVLMSQNIQEYLHQYVIVMEIILYI